MGNAMAKCAILADRHHGLSEGVRSLLRTMFETVVMVADEPSLLESASRLEPALVVADLSLGRKGGLAWVSRLRAGSPGVRVILISVHDEPGVARAASSAGADGFVLKRAIASELLPAVEAVLAGRPYP